jgi:hypothetical protein
MQAMRRMLVLAVATGLVMAMAAPSMAARRAAAAAPAGSVTDNDVTRAIEKGREWLANQQAAGLWPEQSYWHALNPCGNTEIATMTLLYTGSHPVNGALMVQALDVLLNRQLSYTYAVCCRTMARAYAMKKMQTPGPKQTAMRQALVADAQWLVNAQWPTGGWSYRDKTYVHRIDFSNTQFAILALWEASKVGVEIPEIVWQRAMALYIKNQQEDGSWNYGPGTEADGNGYGSMTAAGLATLYICMDMLDLASGCPCSGARPAGNRADLERRMALAMSWLEKNFAVNTNPAAPGNMVGWRTYWLYAVERVGMAAGYKYFGTHDWFHEGAATLIAEQAADGSWGREAEGGAYSTTCFAVLFLYKGRAPILFNKLQDTSGGEKWDWNSHRRDIANLTAWIERQKEQPFQWQIVSLRAPVEELHDAPILYISAATPPKFTDEEKKKLRAYTDTGGTILVEPSCGAPAVKEWFKKFAAEVWPEWPLAPLGPDHGSFLDPYPLKPRPEIMGINDGERTCVFYALDDISCPWQTKAFIKGEYLFKWGINLFTYATDHSPLRAKLAAQAEKSDRYTSTVKGGGKSNLTVARLKTATGDWIVNRNYKPFDVIAAEVSKRAGITLKAEDGGTDPSGLAGKDVAYLTGSKEFTLSAPETAALKAYLDKGGFLLADAAGGASAFDQTFRKLAGDMGLEVKPFDKNSALLTGKFKAAAGYSLTSDVQFRHALRLLRSGRSYAELAGLYLNGKLVGIYSPFDVIFSSTFYEAYGCKGYKTDDAIAVILNILAAISDR